MATTQRMTTVERLSPRLWFAAGIELAVAILVGAILLHYRNDEHATHSMPGGHSHHYAAQPLWTPAIVATVLTAAALVWWAISRTRIAAVLAGTGLVLVAASEPVRVMAAQSHLVAMAALEAMLVAAPLLLVSALQRGRRASIPRRSGVWTAGVIVAVGCYGAFLIVIHLPSVHNSATGMGAVPMWIATLTVVTGFGYWTAILLTAERVAPRVRRSALIVGQEVAAILGMAALVLPSSSRQHANPLGLSTSMDQRLGGILMIIACAAVTLPLISRLDDAPVPQHFRTEHDVH